MLILFKRKINAKPIFITFVFLLIDRVFAVFRFYTFF